jgi:hypothetical protein
MGADRSPHKRRKLTERGTAMTKQFVKMLALSLASVLLLFMAATLSAAGM